MMTSKAGWPRGESLAARAYSSLAWILGRTCVFPRTPWVSRKGEGRSFVGTSGPKVIKQNNNIYFTHKGFNGRILCQYFAEVSRLACSADPAESIAALAPRRTFGKWLVAEMSSGAREYPVDRKMPFQARCMCLASTSLNWFLS